MKDVKLIGQSEQCVIDKAHAYNNLINETNFGDGKIKTVHEAIVQRLLCEAEELGLNIDHEPFASLGNRQFTSYRVPEDAYLYPWYHHVNNFCQVEQVIQTTKMAMSELDFNGMVYKVSMDPDSGIRTYSLDGNRLCDCTGTPTLQDFKNLFSEERRRYCQQIEKTLQG